MKLDQNEVSELTANEFKERAESAANELNELKQTCTSTKLINTRNKTESKRGSLINSK